MNQRPRLLIVHHNYPGQFLHLFKKIVTDGFFVLFIHDQQQPNKRIINARIIGLDIENTKDNLAISQKYLFTESSIRVHRVLESEKREGRSYDIALTHSGWSGCYLVRDIFPNIQLISYLEWWFSVENSKNINQSIGCNIVKVNNNDEACRRNIRSSAIITQSDLLISPTKFQSMQYPKVIRQQIDIIHEGIDFESFSSKKGLNKADGSPIILYATRGMEAIRCFPQFIQSVPFILEMIPNSLIFIGGIDKIFYGGEPIDGYESNGAWARTYLRNYIDSKRVMFLGKLNRSDYTRILHMADLYVYFSAPFALSWSMLEAIACKTLIIASNTAAVKEVLGDDYPLLCDHNNIDDVLENISKGVEMLKKDMNAITTSLYLKTVDRYSSKLNTCALMKILGI